MRNTDLHPSMATTNKALEFAIQIEIDSVLFYTERKRFIHNSQWPIVDGHYLKLSNLQKEIETNKG
jgi:hypothetical protein